MQLDRASCALIFALGASCSNGESLIGGGNRASPKGKDRSTPATGDGTKNSEDEKSREKADIDGPVVQWLTDLEENALNAVSQNEANPDDAKKDDTNQSAWQETSSLRVQAGRYVVFSVKGESPSTYAPPYLTGGEGAACGSAEVKAVPCSNGTPPEDPNMVCFLAHGESSQGGEEVCDIGLKTKDSAKKRYSVTVVMPASPPVPADGSVPGPVVGPRPTCPIVTIVEIPTVVAGGSMATAISMIQASSNGTCSHDSFVLGSQTCTCPSVCPTQSYVPVECGREGDRQGGYCTVKVVCS